MILYSSITYINVYCLIDRLYPVTYTKNESNVLQSVTPEGKAFINQYMADT